MYLFLFQILLLIRVLQHIEQSFLCYTVGPCWLPILSVKVKLLSHVQFFATPWTVAYQAPPSMGFSRQEYWGGLPFSIVVCKCNKEEKIYLQHCNFTSSVYTINHLSIPTSIYLVRYKILSIVFCPIQRTSLVAQTIKPTMQETWVRSLGQENPLEKKMAIHSCTLT